MPVRTTPRGRVIAHVTRIRQDSEHNTTLVMSEAQLLELLRVVTVALREKRPFPEGYQLRLWNKKRVARCTDNPPCEGGQAIIAYVRNNRPRPTDGIVEVRPLPVQPFRGGSPLPFRAR